MEAWGALDRLIWQDVSAERLTTDQLDALRTWVAMGGDLVTWAARPAPGHWTRSRTRFSPIAPSGWSTCRSPLPQLLGTLPAGATPLPALAGILRDGSVLGSTAGPDGSGELVVGARTSIGRGSTTILGIDPAIPWLAGSAVARDVWTGILRPDVLASGIVANQDDGMLVNALDYLPSVGLPPMDQLFLLFVAYLLLIGPVNYVVLRRLDRREWAWVTMPVLASSSRWRCTPWASRSGGRRDRQRAGHRPWRSGTDGTGQIHVGSVPPAATYEVPLPGGALLCRSTATLGGTPVASPPTWCRAIRPASASSRSASARCVPSGSRPS